VILLLMVLPWLVLLVAVPFVMWLGGPRVRVFGPPAADEAPLVSIIVPARNEAKNISMCVASLMNSVYPRREIIVVDDDSVDGTGDILHILEEHSSGGLRIVAGEPLPAGWLGKPWACWQGYQKAQGELLLFTDADTRHDDTLLGHAVGALGRRQVDMVSVLPRQLLVGFWERLIMPQIFGLIMLRYADLRRVNRARVARDVIANGQFLLIRREAYEAIGGHEALRAEVVEDQAMAQRLVESGRRLVVAHADDLMETRMYRSLREIIDGWSKNLATGMRRAAPGWMAPAMPWIAAAVIALLWVLPAGVLAASYVINIVPQLEAWSLLVWELSLLFWLAILIRLRVPPLFVLGYPLAASSAVALVIRSGRRGPRVEWKGRAYRLDSAELSTPRERVGSQSST
jgi:chlorobactene glucosyltransferase